MRVVFWGTPAFAVPTLTALVVEGHDVVGVVTQPDRPAGRGRKPRPSPVKQAALEEGVPVLTPDRPHGAAFEAELRALRPEVNVVVAYGHILRPEVLEIPERGSWNVHASLLPELRGAAPIHWAIARGHEVTGVSVMRMTEGMDSGPVLLQAEVAIEPLETSTELAGRLSGIGAQALVEAMGFLEFGGVEVQEQDHARATYAPKVSREVARIDWSRSAREVVDHVRAMDAVPGAWTEWEGEPLKLFRPSPERPDDAPDVALQEDGGPGVVVGAAAGPGGVLAVRTGDGVAWIREVQPAGKRRMDVGSWLPGRGAATGDRFV